MNSRKAFILFGLAFAIGAPVYASAQTPSPSAASLATQKARAFLAALMERHASGINGTVRITPQGSGSLVDVTLSQPLGAAKTMTLMSGTDCIDGVDRRAATMIPLNPITGKASRTLVQIPFSAFKPGHFIVDVRDATARTQLAEACARM
jgi:hypothetical protein